MSHLPDDPRLTAFALDELDEIDRPEVEALLKADPEARACVEEIRATARLLVECLRDEPGPGLAPEHHLAIETRLGEVPRPDRKPRRRWIGLAVAASLLGLAFTLTLPWLRSRHPETPSLAMSPLPKQVEAIGREPAIMSNARPPILPAPASAPPALESARDYILLSQEPADKLASHEHIFRSPDLKTGMELKPGATSPAKRELEVLAERMAGGAEGSQRHRTEPQSYAPAQLQAGSMRGMGADKAEVASGQAPAPSPARAMKPASSSMALGMSSGGAANAPAADSFSIEAPPTVLYARAVESSPAPAPPAPVTLGKKIAAPKSADRLDDGAAAPGNGPAEARDKAKDGPASPKEARLEEQLSRKSGEAEESQLGTVDQKAEGGLELGEIGDRRRQLQDLEAKADREAFAPISDNPFLTVAANPLSTFSIDVDTASYANVRRFLNQNARPPADAVRIEELINYFPYAYPAPKADEPFAVSCEVARAPWDAGHRLVRIGLKGREIEADKRAPTNLVFLIDVSGSMDEVDKLPLLKAGMKLLVEQLGENDRVAIVVYASQEGLVLDSTHADRKAEILSSLERLQAGGSTNGGRGILLAYETAVRHFIKGGINRVILATDGDFNVGVTQGPELDRLIEEKRQSGVFLSVLGFGRGNVKHDKLEGLADKGNGQYCYIDSIKEARKVLVEQMGGTLAAIAKDVKIQVQFDPEKAESYRLIGYENRLLQARDFDDDTKDAGEIGAGHCVTALYEVVPAGQGGVVAQDQQDAKARASRLARRAAGGNSRLLDVKLRFKAPDGDVSKLIAVPADDDGRDFSAATPDFRFASAVAGFGMLLRDSPYKGSLTWDGLVELASGAVGADPGGYRSEFLELARKAREVAGR